MNVERYDSKLILQYVRVARGRLPVKISVGHIHYRRNAHADGMK
jgi:hypothetical protein